MKTLYTPTAKQIYFWNFAGSMLNALLSVVLLLVASILLNDQQTDIFSLAWSFGMQSLTIGAFQVRLYQSTDIDEKFTFNQYLIFRIITVFIMVVYSAIYIFLSDYTPYKSAIVFLVCLAKVSDAFSDLFQGWFQQKERLDLAGKAFSAHSLCVLIVFGVSIITFKNLLLACIMIAAGNFITLFLFDYRYFVLSKQKYKLRTHVSSSKFLLNLVTTCLPLFINAYIIMDIFNQPRFSIDSAISTGALPDGSQKIYNILFLPASALNLLFIIFRPLITQLAVHWNSNDRANFLKIIKNISLYLVALSAAVLIGGYFLGCPVLSLIYNVELTNFKSTLLIIIVGGLLNTFMYLLDNSITVIRCHSYLIIAYIITWLYTLLMVDVLVEKFGLFGAGLCFASSMLILLLCTAIIFFICVNKNRQNK